MAQYVPDATKTYEPDVDNLVLALKGTTVLSGGAITAQGTPDMTVDVATGVIRAAGAVYTITNTDLTVTTADTNNPRIDIIVKDTTASGVPAIVAGTPLATPKPPALPANRLLLGYISISAGATTITDANISDRRLTVGDGILSGTTAAQPAAGDVPAGTFYYDSTLDQLQRSDASSWLAVFSDATVSLAGLMPADEKKQLTSQAEATTTGNVDIDFALGLDVEVGPTTGNIDIDLANGEAGRWHFIKIEYGGTHTVTFNDTINWAGDSAPTATSVSGKHDFYFLYRNRAGTEWFGSSGSQDHP